MRPLPRLVDWKHYCRVQLLNSDMTTTIAIRAIHFPKDGQQREAAREHLVLSEFFAMQILIASRRTNASIRVGEAHCGPAYCSTNS